MHSDMVFEISSELQHISINANSIFTIVLKTFRLQKARCI